MNTFIQDREFLGVFYFPSDFIVVAENFKRNFSEVSVLSKCFQSLGIEPIISLNILYGWQWENLVKFL